MVKKFIDCSEHWKNGNVSEIKNFADEYGYLFFKQCLDVEENLNVKRQIDEILLKYNYITETGDFNTDFQDMFYAGGVGPDEYFTDINYLEDLHSYMHQKMFYDVMKIITGKDCIPIPRLVQRTIFPNNPRLTTLPHQDHWYAGMANDLWTIWVPFGDVPIELGTMKINSQSHILGEIPPEQRYFHEKNQMIAFHPTNFEEWVSDNFQTGDFLMFNVLTQHGNNHNISSKVRSTLDVRYQPIDERFFDLFFDTHSKDLEWKDIYSNFKDKSKCFYWDRYNLNIVPDESLSSAVHDNHATIKIDFNDTLQ